MINSNISNLATTLNTGVLANADDKIATAETSTTVNRRRQTADGVVLNISSEGRERLAKENNELGKELAQQLHAKTSNAAKEAEEENNSQDPIDALIADLKEQIDEIKEKLKALVKDKSEGTTQSTGNTINIT